MTHAKSSFHLLQACQHYYLECLRTLFYLARRIMSPQKKKKDNTFSLIKFISLPAVKAASGFTCLMFSYQNLSPNLYRLNCSAKRHEKVGPRIPPSTGFSVSPPAYRSISCGLLFEKSENYYMYMTVKVKIKPVFDKRS